MGLRDHVQSWLFGGGEEPAPTPPLPRALFRANRAELAGVPLKVTSARGDPLPASLRGHLFAVGLVGDASSGGLPYPQDRSTSMFAGDGLVLRFDFTDDGPTVSTRLVRTADWYADRATADPASPYHRLAFANHGMIRISLPLGLRDLLNTAFLPIAPDDEGGLPRLLATYDAGRPWELDTASLDAVTPMGWRSEWHAEALGFQPFPTTFSTAHPVWDAARGELFSVNYGKGFGSLLGLLPFVSTLDDAWSDALWAASRRISEAGFPRLARAVAGIDRAGQRLLVKLQALLPQSLHGLVPEEFLHLVRWDGKGNLERWELVTRDGRWVEVQQSMHQIAVTERWVVLLDTGFKIGLEQLFANPFPGFPAIERLLRWWVSNPLRPTAILHFVDRELLEKTPGHMPRNGGHEVQIPVTRSITLPLPAVHFLADYRVDTSEGRSIVTLHVPHCEATDIAEWIRPYDLRAWGRKRIDPAILSVNASGADVNTYARYRIDVNSGAIVDSAVVADDRLTWGLSLVAAPGVGTAEPLPEAFDVLYYTSAGFWTEQLTRFIDDLYARWPNRVVPHETLKTLWRSGDRPSSVFAVDTATLRVIDRYEVPKTAIVFTPQFLRDPARAGPRGGWLSVMAWTSERPELWILDAANLAQGPLWKLHADELVVGLTVHSAWLDKVGPRTDPYRVDVRADLDPAVAWRSSLVRDLFTNEVYPHFP